MVEIGVTQASQGWLEVVRSNLTNDRDFYNYMRSEVEKVLPEWFKKDNQTLILFLETYYEFLNSSEEFGGLIKNLQHLRNNILTPQQYLDNLKYEYLLGSGNYPGIDDLRRALSTAALLFKSKGTSEGIKLFFKLFYNTDVTVTYTRENVFKLEQSLDSEGTLYSTGSRLQLVPQQLLLYDSSTTVWNYINLDSTSNAGIIGAVYSLADSEDSSLDDRLRTLLLTVVDSNGSGTDYVRANVTRTGGGRGISDSDAIELKRYFNRNYSSMFDSVGSSAFIEQYIVNDSNIQSFFNAPVNWTAIKNLDSSPYTPYYITNDKLYQELAILITTTLDPNVYVDVYKKIAHPAGMYFEHESA